MCSGYGDYDGAVTMHELTPVDGVAEAFGERQGRREPRDIKSAAASPFNAPWNQTGGWQTLRAQTAGLLAVSCIAWLGRRFCRSGFNDGSIQ